MATYQTITSNQRLSLNWDDPTAWAGGVVPNATDADVTLTAAGYVDGSSPEVVTIQPGESFVVRTLGSTGGTVTVDGTLAVTGTISAGMTLAGGTINANGLSGDVIGYGTVTVAGSLQLPGNSGYSDLGLPLQTYLESSGGALSITAASLNNAGGKLVANGAPLTITVTGGPGAFSQLSGNTLLPSGTSSYAFTRGTYQAENGGGTLSFNVGGVIANDGAVIVLGSPTEAASSAADLIQSYDSSTGQYQPLQATLQVVTGELDIDGSQNFATINPLTVSGLISLVNGGTLSTPSLTVLSGGTLSGAGTVSGPITDNGTISASASYTTGTLFLSGPVSGSGSILVTGTYGQQSVSLELGGSTSTPVAFQNGFGVLQLDDPAAFTGTIQVAQSQGPYTTFTSSPISDDQVILQGVAAASVTGYSYAGNASAGTLTIQEGATQQTLNFIGNLSTASFSLSGDSNLDITATPLPATPTLGLALPSGRNPVSGVITNSNALTVAGATTAGAAVSVATGGVTAAASISKFESSETYAATISPPLAAGLQQVATTVAATNSAGSAQSTAALNVDLLPAPINGVTTADLSSADLKTLLNQGFVFNFASGTQAVQLTNGTLSLGTGTTQALVETLYTALLHRAGDPAGIGNYVSQINNGVSVATVAQGLLDSPEGSYFAMGTEPANTFVLQLYHSFLNRDPSAADQAYYVNTLNAGATRGQVVAVIATSPEAAKFAASTPQYFTNLWGLDPQGSLLTELYQTALGRDPELTAVQADKQQLTAGLTPQALAQIIASSAEFQADHNGQSPADFVTSLYQSGLGRTPGASELQGWVNQIQAGATPAAITYGIATSTEATGHLSPTI